MSDDIRSRALDLRARAAWHAYDWFYERRLSTDTNRASDLADDGLDDADRIDYVPTPWRVLPRALPRCSVTPHDVFLDLGCGKGRVMTQAALDYGFGGVVGVELSPRLASIARTNLTRNEVRMRAAGWRVTTGDVLDVEIPAEASVVFMFNPFVGATFRKVAEGLRTSFDRVPRHLRIVYHNPTELEVLERAGFRTVQTFRRTVNDTTALLVPG